MKKIEVKECPVKYLFNLHNEIKLFQEKILKDHKMNGNLFKFYFKEVNKIFGNKVESYKTPESFLKHLNDNRKKMKQIDEIITIYLTSMAEDVCHCNYCEFLLDYCPQYDE